MTLEQFKYMSPVSYEESVRLWSHGKEVFRINDDGSESALDDKEVMPVPGELYVVERDKPLTLVHGDSICPVWNEEMLVENGYCTLCGAYII